MTTQQSRKFRIDWDVFTRITNFLTAQTNAKLYNCADEAIQNSIINTYPDFFNTSPNKLLDMLEVLVMWKSNPMVHRISFSSITQSDNETIQNYTVRLWSRAQDCDFICPHCHHDLSHIYIKDQFIRGLQADMLAKAGSLKTLEQNISHAEAFEMAMPDQNGISGISDMAGLQMSVYCQQRRAQDVARSTATRRRERTVAETRPKQNVCKSCGSHQHSGAGSGDRPQMCPAWGQMCRAYIRQNHFEMVCQLKGTEKQCALRCIEDEEAAMDALIAHRVFDPATETYKLGNSGLKELEATIIPFSPCPVPRWIRDIPTAHPTRLKIYPNIGTTICLGGLTHLQHMGLSERNLVPTKKKSTHRQRIFFGMSKLVTCHIWNWELSHKAGSVYMQQNTSNIFQQSSLYWCQDITSMLSQTHDIATISNMRCHTSRYPIS